MRQYLVILISLCFLQISCRKAIEYITDPIENTITGEWVFTEYFMSPGDAGQWHEANPAGRIAEFKADGSFVSTRHELKNFNRYELVDNDKVKLLTAYPGGTTLLLRFSVETDKALLYIYPGEYLCFEGCSDKYRKVK